MAVYRCQDFEIQRLVEEITIDIAHIGLKQTVLPTIGEIGIIQIR